MNTTFTNYAEKKAKQFLNLLQGYTKGIRMTAILILLLMGVSSVNAETIMRFYCKQEKSWWNADGAAVGAYAWKNSNTSQKNANWPGVRMTKVSGQTNLWYADIDIDKYDRIIFTRVNGSGTIADWGAKTGDLTINNQKNQYTITQSSGAWNGATSAGSWGTYKPTSTASLTASPTSVSVGEAVTLTPSLSSNTDANTYSSTSYSFSPATASVNGNTFTATAADTYTVTATVTYYAKGCPSLTSTATATAEIEVKNSEVLSTITITTNPAEGGRIEVDGQPFDPGNTVQVGATTTKKVTTIPNEGYGVIEWGVSDKNIVIISGGHTVTLKSDGSGRNGTLTARYTPISRNIQFDKQSGEGGTETATVTYTQNNYSPASVVAPTRAGYTFGGYYSEEKGAGEQVVSAEGQWLANATDYTNADGNWLKSAENTTLYAYWIGAPYTVTLDQTGAAKSGTEEVIAHYEADMPDIDELPVAQDGYAFMGYFDQKDGKGTKYYNAEGTSECVWDKAKDATLYAYFKAAEITINLNAASFEPNSATPVIATATLKPEPVGTTSICWELLYNDDTSVAEHAPQETGDNQVQFNINDLATGTYQIKATLREGAGCTGTIISHATQVFTITSDHTITIRYVDENGQTIKASTTQSAHVSSLTEITAPEIGGYKFVNWELGDGIFSESDLKSETIEYTAIYDGYLTAKYEKKKLIFLDLSNQFGETEWTEPHIYLYSGSYWDNTNGTGGNNANCIANGAMTRVGTSNIWYYDYESVKNFNGYVAFTPTDQSTLTRFKDTEAIYRYDFSSGTPVFVPAQGQRPHSAYQVNGTKAQYYNKGHWTKYMGGTGYTLKIYNKKENERTEVMSVPFTGSSLYLPFTAIADLEEGKTYGYKIVRDNDKWYKNDNDGTMTSTSCTNWPFVEDNSNGLACGIQTVATGDHTFTLTLNATTGNLEVSVDYPAKVGNYRILYTDDVREGRYKPSQIISQNNTEPLVSFFIRPNNNPVLKIQKATLVTEEEVKWDNKVLYLTPNSNWKLANARFAAAFMNNDKTQTKWVSMTSIKNGEYYGCAIPTGTWKYVIFCRMNGSTTENNWENKWDQTNDLNIPTDGKNQYTVEEGEWSKGKGTWSKHNNDILDLSTALKEKLGELGLTNIKDKEGTVFNIHLSNNDGTPTIEKVALYTGNYYIRVDAVDGKWYDYKTNPDNLMTYSAFSESEANSFGEKFSHYKTKWCEAGTNVKFTIANDYSHCISDTLAQDINSLGNLTDEGTLLNNDIYDVNIRFMWNWKTNKISRAYVGPAGDKQSQFLMLKACEEIQDAEGNKLNPAEGDILDKENDIYAARFTDTQNWIYERTIQVKPRTRVKLYASYPNGYHIYIENNTGWKDVALYAFKNDGDRPLGNWPGVQPTRTVEIEGKTYYDFPVNKYVFGSTLIFNNNVKENGQQTSNYTDFATVGEYYLTASSNKELTKNKYVQTTVEATAQYFRGEYAEGSCDDEHTIQILGGEGETWNTIRVIYDFKTNRLMAAWMPNNNEIDTVRSIESDVMIIRDHQNAAQCITFANDSSKLTYVKTVYGVMRFNRWILNNRGGADNLDIKSCTKVVDNQTVYDHDTTNHYHPILEPAKQTSQYERALYFISFPFDVHLSDVFGFGTYGQHWIIEYYDGLKRAKEGYWIDSDPNWKYVTDPANFVLEKYKGYILCLNLGKMAYDNTDFWAHNISQVELFFPSTTTMEEIAKAEVTMPKLGEEYLCKINRGDGTEGDRRVKDSYWRCIGVPSYANYSNVLKDSLQQTIQWQTSYKTFPFLYKWNKTDNTLTPQSTTNFKFETMHAYLVQNGGEIHWSAVNATPDKPNAGIIAKVKETTRNYEWRITLTQGEKEQDQAFVRLSDNEQVTTEFDFNQDLSKEFNYGRSDIYTLIGYEKAAANSLPFSEQTTLIPLGLSIEYNGDYTIAMPDGTANIGVTLIDTESNTRSNLSAGMEYTLTLKKGDYNNRFFIEISPIQQTPTDIEYVENSHDDQARKVLIDNILYIVRDGQIFDARGARVK